MLGRFMGDMVGSVGFLRASEGKRIGVHTRVSG